MSRFPFTLSRRAVLAGLLTSGASLAIAEAPEVSHRPPPRPSERGVAVAPAKPAGPSAPSAESLVEKARLGEASQVGFVVADAATGEVLEVMNPDLGLPPASTMKTITSLYALKTLGPSYRFKTRLIATGPIEDGVLKGDLALVGSGDPTLDTNRLAELAVGLKAAGVTAVEGLFLTWSQALPQINAIDPDQPVQVGYNPGISGLNLNFNRVHFEWHRAGKGWDTTMDARSDSYRPAVTTARMSVDPRKMPIYTYADNGDAEVWSVASWALGESGSRWLPVRRPSAYTAEVLQDFAKLHGIVLPTAEEAASAPQGTVLAEVESEDLREILRDMLKYSTNMTAEAVGLTTTAARAGRPEPLPVSAAQMGDWLGERITLPPPTLVDHSGLGGTSRITANDMVQALVQIGPEVDLEPILKPIRMKDDHGRPDPGYPVTIQGKTGTLNFVSALAGYATLPEGRKLAFTIFTADVPRRDALTIDQREGPEGLQPWLGRSRNLQLRLIDRWCKVHAPQAL
ncbi:D-alanyl-D-alanine carboxypeptidase/D-alanyl-D-alanine-endopeptidase [Tropicimonas sp. IMCC34043]|uniref:D-alanyl-D-alanine carboxypeptidase/D-alanyl-D-alanine endopeptidase n=1 Tax=Tropicimonas sp. IMCC34043 TaxID=2248760 RepID=UPI000E22E4EC|nr:D-alanyl-D-alanine carboxypeptidase/D-alanyl-D-alanine-endopeptidase [Tropicimonas sp. IMCC34043]